MKASTTYYKDLVIDELVQDEYFIQSMLHPVPDSEAFWQHFLMEYPLQQPVVEAARQLVKDLRFEKNKPAAGAKERVWEQAVKVAGRTAVVVPMKRSRRWIVAAAVTAGLLLVAATWWVLERNSNKTMVSVQYGELRQLTLPDQSVVTLNANSSIEYKKEWKEGEPREVWLKGEAFFEVKHLNKEGQEIKAFDRFIVHAGNTNVEVLGTTFNVSDRKEVTQVLLQTGKVRVNFEDKITGSVTMTPGELVKYDQKTKQVLKNAANTEKYIAWRRKELVLNNTTVQEVINTIENNFGYKVEVDNEDLLDRQLSGTGTVSLENEVALFQSLELILNIDITKEGRTLHLKDK